MCIMKHLCVWQTWRCSVSCRLWIGGSKKCTDKHTLGIYVLNYFTKVIEKDDYTDHKQIQCMFTQISPHPGFSMGYGTSYGILHAGRIPPELRNKPDLAILLPSESMYLLYIPEELIPMTPFNFKLKNTF